MFSALSVGFCAFALGGFGSPPVKPYFLRVFLLPIAMCGLVTVAILPALVAPAVAVSSTWGARASGPCQASACSNG